MYPKEHQILDDFKKQERSKTRDDGINTVLLILTAAGLAYGAFRTPWHAGLFGFLAYLICAVGNRVCNDLRAQNVRYEINRQLDGKNEG